MLWGAVFLTFRLLCLYFWSDAAWTPEETYRGNVGLEFLRALHGHPLALPFFCYQADAYLGGSLVTGAFAAAAFALFGPSLFALKLTALLFALAALLLAYRWLDRQRGAAAANTFAALYTFAPPAFTFLGATAMGYHTESVLFFAVLLSLTTAKEGPGRLFLAGLVGGFAFWFSNLNALAVLASLASGPRDWRKPKPFAGFFFGSLLGLTPWLARNIASGFDALRHLAWSFNGDSHFEFFSKALHFFTQALPLSTSLSPPLAWAYFLFVLAFLFTGWRRVPSPLARFTLVYAAAFFLLYVPSNFAMRTGVFDPVQFRYLQPFWFLIFLCLAAGTTKRRPALLLLLPVSLAGFFLVDRVAPSGHAWRYRGYSYADLASKQMSSCLKGAEKLPALLAWIHSFPDPERAYLEIPFVGAYDFSGLASASLPPEATRDPLFARGLGAFSGGHLRAEEISQLASAFPLSTGKNFWLGVAETARFFPIPSILKEYVSQSRIDLFTALDSTAHLCLAGARSPPLTSAWEARGQGAGIADCGFTPARIRELADAYGSNQSGEYRANFAWGLGWRLRLRHLPDPLRAMDRVRALPEWAQAKALEGALAQEQELGLTGPESVANY